MSSFEGEGEGEEEAECQFEVRTTIYVQVEEAKGLYGGEDAHSCVSEGGGGRRKEAVTRECEV